MNLERILDLMEVTRDYIFLNDIEEEKCDVKIEIQKTDVEVERYDVKDVRYSKEKNEMVLVVEEEK